MPDFTNFTVREHHASILLYYSVPQGRHPKQKSCPLAGCPQLIVKKSCLLKRHPSAADHTAYSTVTINLPNPRKTLFIARPSASMWKRLTLCASAMNKDRISSFARLMPRHPCGPAPNAM
jgi:hypothetical protein